MDIFEERYLNLNKKLLTFIGLWPYGSVISKIYRVLFMLLLVLLSIPHLISVILHYEDIDRLMLSILSFLIAMVVILKIVALTIAENKMKRLYESIANNWLVICDKREHDILVEYSERARKFTIFYSISMTIAGTMISVLPLTTKVLDKIIPLQEPRPNLYLLEGEYFVDRGVYYNELFFCDLIITWMVALTTIAVDTMYIASTEHGCALNAIISYRLQNLGRDSSESKLTISTDDLYKQIIDIIELHQNTLSFTSTINEAFSLNFLFIMTVNILLIPLDTCAMIANLDEPIRFCPFFILFGALTLHLLTIFYPGQRILDHNISLCDDVYCNEWYVLPLRIKKLLLVFMLRCSQPATLSAGGLFLINLEIYSMVMRTAISYITVLASFR